MKFLDSHSLTSGTISQSFSIGYINTKTELLFSAPALW